MIYETAFLLGVRQSLESFGLNLTLRPGAFSRRRVLFALARLDLRRAIILQSFTTPRFRREPVAVSLPADA